MSFMELKGKTVLLVKLNLHLSPHSSNSTLKYVLTRSENICPQKHRTRIFTDILFIVAQWKSIGNKKRNTCNNIDES